ncbi:hypothetical protein [Streptomyces sclerotialus]|uniref:hypothetical protein n=1 Tax=Streptomyces sclerotialus TaxID=1957 RepID=UPI0004C66A48
MRPICICHVCGGIYLPPDGLYYPTAGIWASLTECAGCMPVEGGPAGPDTRGLRYPIPAKQKPPAQARAGRRPRKRKTGAGGDPSGARMHY